MSICPYTIFFVCLFGGILGSASRAEFPVSLGNLVGITPRLLYSSTHHSPERFTLIPCRAKEHDYRSQRAEQRHLQEAFPPSISALLSSLNDHSLFQKLMHILLSYIHLKFTVGLSLTYSPNIFRVGEVQWLVICPNFESFQSAI